jgi:O-methyltransferase involved in polyketide biosynthesis
MNYDRISLTAKLAAYMRRYTDIPFAEDVARLLQAEQAFEKLLQDSGMSPQDLLWYAPIFEVRYKSIASRIRKSGLRQVLELASGVSLRGLAMTQDTDITYAETDLPDLTEEKLALVGDLRRQYDLEPRGILHLVVANALDRQQLQAATQHFQHDQPIAVVNEGLFQYLNVSEMETVVHNVHDLLADFGGMWITPDFSLKADVQDVSPQQRKFRQVVAAATDHPMYSHTFDTGEQLLAFLHRMGLKAVVVNQIDEAPELVSPDSLNLPPLMVERTVSRLKLWIVELA